MHIQKIMRFDKKSKEAEVIVSDGAYEILCYAFPIDTIRIGMIVGGLSGFSCGNVVRAVRQHCAVSKLPSYFAYHMTGIVLSKQERIVCVGGLKIRLDESIPNDISDGEYVSFEVQRLDLD